ncbi:hypothetical protein B0H14DRAFT_2349767, partial [Mycena olivaceomarginata]
RLTLDTVIEADGANLSMGERSLLSLVRALVKDSRVVILAEVTKLFSVKQLIHLRTGPWSSQLKIRFALLVHYFLRQHPRCVPFVNVHLSLLIELCVVLDAEKIAVSVTRVLFE